MILFPYHSILLIIHSFHLLTLRGRGNVCFLNTTYLLVHSISTFSLVALPSDTLIVTVEEAHITVEEAHVTVEETPTSFSPFSLVDCMLLSHISFNDFVTVAFLDLAGDLDTQI